VELSSASPKSPDTPAATPPRFFPADIAFWGALSGNTYAVKLIMGRSNS